MGCSCEMIFSGTQRWRGTRGRAAPGDEGAEEDDSEPAADAEAEDGNGDASGTSALEWKSAFKLFHLLG